MNATIGIQFRLNLGGGRRQREPKAERAPISEEQARHIVEEYHEKNSHYDLFGAITITSVEHWNHEYEVK
ncbi:hypothetical protein [Paenibacillus sacheonensis]|uniref:Uncharacterized protein n=1 Tax=Paenibacillus sacheonensis TaxID=742054 RepID=A0A7X4YRG5_9BACL|nr:hypothetical protein [Paenibacillus sacheonensis]MBM7565016.1 hypothetical protein [Paenibacillus sacheonensis]NBC70199.1 hypothetical protein [Paenibacillus sacheonensis]